MPSKSAQKECPKKILRLPLFVASKAATLETEASRYTPALTCFRRRLTGILGVEIVQRGHGCGRYRLSGDMRHRVLDYCCCLGHGQNAAQSFYFQFSGAGTWVP